MHAQACNGRKIHWRKSGPYVCILWPRQLELRNLEGRRLNSSAVSRARTVHGMFVFYRMNDCDWKLDPNVLSAAIVSFAFEK